ncbi:MAG: signal peptidase II [Ilumatobacteraceae bacterium]
MTPARTLRLAALIGIVTAVDLLTKLWASTALEQSRINLPGMIDLQLSHNSGVAFGALQGAPSGVIVGITTLVAAGIIAAGVHGVAPLVPAGLVAGGAVGNILDRLEGGSVIDMFHTSFWPTFNLADVFLSVGVGLWLVDVLRIERSGTVQPSEVTS